VTEEESSPAGRRRLWEDESLTTKQVVEATLADQLGDKRGMVESSLPVLVFVVANLIGGLRPAIWTSLATATVVLVVRLARREKLQVAVNGFVAVLVAVIFARSTGRAKDFYLPGILLAVAYGLGFLISVVVRHPLVGYIWTLAADRKLDGTWREDRRLLRAYGVTTLMWAGMFLVKVAVQLTLYLANQDTALGISRLAMGYPLMLAVLALTIWYVRRVQAGAAPAPTPAPAPDTAPEPT
jgi:hypothetical protein